MMNYSQKFLFERVGFDGDTLLHLANKYNDPISNRTARYWQQGKYKPNPAIVETALRLDEYLDKKAEEIKEQYYDKPLVLPFYDNAQQYWAKTDDYNTPLSVYTALVMRICQVKKSTQVLHFNDKTDADCLNLSVNFDWGF